VTTIRPLREDLIRRMRAEHVRSARMNPTMWRDSRLEHESGGGFPVTGPWSFRETCPHEHGWDEVGEHWLQCRRCWWCKPRLGRPPRIEMLPAILKGRVLPPLSGRVSLSEVYANAGFVVDDDRRSVLSVVRVRVVQHTWVSDPDVRRCGVEVRFNGRGWREAAVFMETWLHRLVGVLRDARPRRPRALWAAIQAAMEQKWVPPWERERWDALETG
jgi:hypothetical protein